MSVLPALRERLDLMADRATRDIFSDVFAYEATAADQALVDDVRMHVYEHYDALVTSLERDEDVRPEDVLFVRRHAVARIGRINVAEFIHAFQVGQRVVLDEALALAHDDATRRLVLRIVPRIARYFNTVTAHAAEVYLEAEEALASTGERVRRDLLEDLLAGQSPPPGPELDAARKAGLEPAGPCVVVAALPTARLSDPHALRAAATALARTARRAVAPLAVARHDEVVVIVPVSADEFAEAAALAKRVVSAQKRLAREKVPLAVGMSSVHTIVAHAYGEAVTARDRLLPAPGVVALPAMTMFEYLTGGGDEVGTARRMMPPAIARFVAEDREAGGVLTATLEAYSEANLNVKDAAERLHVHVNTAHYRLSRVAERTGCDLRSIRDVIELLIAIRL